MRATSIYMSISALGAAGAPLVMAPTMEQFGWRAVFLLSGVVGLMTAVVWFVLMPADALRLATEGGARCLGRDDIGVLEPGRRADLAVWPGDDLADMADPVTALVLGPDRTVRHLLVGGEPVVEDGTLRGLDLPAARRELAARAQRLWS